MNALANLYHEGIVRIDGDDALLQIGLGLRERR